MSTDHVKMFLICNPLNSFTVSHLTVNDFLLIQWANLCESYLVEARWFYSKYTPTLDEYLKNAWISVGGHAGIVYAYMFLGCTVTKGSLDYFKGDSGLIYWSALITRLCDDLGTFAVCTAQHLQNN